MTSRRFIFLTAALGAVGLGGLAWVIFPGLGVTSRPVVALAAAVGGAWLGWKVGREVMRKRRAELRVIARVCKELGLDYERRVPERQMRRYFSLPLFDSRGWRSFRHVMSGPAGEGRVLLFNYQAIDGPNGPRGAPELGGPTVILFPDVGLPEFEMRPRRWWEIRVAPPSTNPRRPDHPSFRELVSAFFRMAFGKNKRRRLRTSKPPPRDWWDFLGQRVRFDPEELPDEAGRELMRSFTRSYTVEVPQGEEEVRRLFSMEKIAFLVGHPGWEVQSYAGHLLLCKGRKKVPLQERPALFREALALAGLFHPPLCPEGPWAGRTVPAPWRIRTKPARFKDRSRPGPGSSSDGRFVGFE